MTIKVNFNIFHLMIYFLKAIQSFSLLINSLIKTFNLDNEIFPSAKDNKKGYVIYKMTLLVFYDYSR